MIKVEMTELPVEKIKKIREWLDKEECAWLENCVASEVAQMQTEATNLSLEYPMRTIGDQNGMSLDSQTLLKRAAIRQSFLDVLKTLRDKETRFQVAKLTI